MRRRLEEMSLRTARGLGLAALLGALCFASALLGCSPEDFLLELGTGEIAFEHLDDETELELVAGPQGGHHVWASFYVWGSSSDRVQMQIDLIPIEGPEPPARFPVTLFLDDMGDGTMARAGWPAELARPECAVGVRHLMRATLTDRDGRVAIDERIVVPVEGPLSNLGVCE